MVFFCFGSFIGGRNVLFVFGCGYGWDFLGNIFGCSLLCYLLIFGLVFGCDGWLW